MDPTEKGELLTKVLALEVGDKSDESEHIQHEADEAVILSEGDEVGIDEDNVLEVVDDRLAVKEVVGDNEEVPDMSAPAKSRMPNTHQFRVLLQGSLTFPPSGVTPWSRRSKRAVTSLYTSA